MNTANDAVIIEDSAFVNNTAQDGSGGALRIYSGNYYAMIRNCR